MLKTILYVIQLHVKFVNYKKKYQVHESQNDFQISKSKLVYTKVLLKHLTNLKPVKTKKQKTNN